MSCRICGMPVLSGAVLCGPCYQSRRVKIEIRHGDGRRETKTEPIDPNLLFLETIDSIPAENRGRLNLIGKGDALTCPWSNPGAPIFDALLRVNEGLMQRTGFPLAQICCSRMVFDGMVLRSNDFRQLTTFYPMHLAVRTVDRIPLPDGAQAYVLGNLTWLEWLVEFDPVREASRGMGPARSRLMHPHGVLFSASCYDLAQVAGPNSWSEWRGNWPALPTALAAADVGDDGNGLVSPVVRWLAPLKPKDEPLPAVPAGWRL